MEYIIVYNEDEIWKPITYKNIRPNMYEVSSYGRIRNIITNKILKQFRSEKGYMMISLMCDDTFRNHTFKTHKIVADAFLSYPVHEPLDGSFWTVDHIKGGYDGKGDCSIYNLRIISDYENKKRASKDGQLKPLRGDKSPSAKITSEIARFIISNLNITTPQIIDKVYNTFNIKISKYIVNDIKRKKTWKHLH